MPSVGDLLAGRYRIDGVLGAGGMASVYSATDLRLERKVAVKVLLPNFAQDAGLAERFDREARVLASVSHPSVAEVFDVERGDPEAGREPFYVMELCEGGSLDDRIAASGPIDPGELVPMLVAIAAALGELHRRGLIHRDVKPGNILFTGGRPKLADFGLAKSGDPLSLPDLTEPGTAIGTPAYMAPELGSGADATVASDVYALAATTFHGLTGRAPRQADSLTGLVRTMTETPPTVSDVRPRLDGRFDAVIAAGLAPDPADRPSLGEFTTGLVEALHRTVGDETLDETTVMRTPSQPTRVAPAPAAPRRGNAGQGTSAGGRRGQLASLVIVTVLAVVAGMLLALVDPGWFTPGGTAGPATATPRPSLPGPSPSIANPTRTPSPSSGVGPAVAQAIEQVDQAIDAARGGPDGLTGNEARELHELTRSAEARLEDGDVAGARFATTQLLARARELVEHVDADRGAALVDAIEDLQARLSEP